MTPRPPCHCIVPTLSQGWCEQTCVTQAGLQPDCALNRSICSSCSLALTQVVRPTLKPWQAQRQQLSIQQRGSTHVHGRKATGRVIEGQQQQA